jgi:hypothetical protein
VRSSVDHIPRLSRPMNASIDRSFFVRDHEFPSLD